MHIIHKSVCQSCKILNSTFMGLKNFHFCVLSEILEIIFSFEMFLELFSVIIGNLIKVYWLKSELCFTKFRNFAKKKKQEQKIVIPYWLYIIRSPIKFVFFFFFYIIVLQPFLWTFYTYIQMLSSYSSADFFLQ